MKQDYAAAIEAELGRLDDLSTQKGKRDKTIRALAQAEVDGISQTSVFKQAGVISQRAYYSKDKDWYHNDLFRDVLGKVTALYLQRENEIREAAEERGRRQRHEERVRLINAAKSKATDLIEQMDTVAQRPDHVARFVATVLAEERTEFDEKQPKKIDVTSGGKPIEPGGAVAIATGAVGGVNLDDLPDDDLDNLIKNLQIAIGAVARQKA
ncbi:MAG: hypothetical protein KA314_05050 [Chloroflexi bacterium]|nr:hypothetical protein [Chloroflexota bacterium]